MFQASICKIGAVDGGTLFGLKATGSTNRSCAEVMHCHMQVHADNAGYSLDHVVVYSQEQGLPLFRQNSVEALQAKSGRGPSDKFTAKFIETFTAFAVVKTAVAAERIAAE